jgi:hypothetical protein
LQKPGTASLTQGHIFTRLVTSLKTINLRNKRNLQIKGPKGPGWFTAIAK